MNKVECPCCLGAKMLMVPNTGKGFHYEPCKFCNGTGSVIPQLVEDYILSLNEDNIDLEDE